MRYARVYRRVGSTHAPAPSGHAKASGAACGQLVQCDGSTCDPGGVLRVLPPNHPQPRPLSPPPPPDAAHILGREAPGHAQWLRGNV
jgi:hypothetical protein